MRIRDWSSDVCSSDLLVVEEHRYCRKAREGHRNAIRIEIDRRSCEAGLVVGIAKTAGHRELVGDRPVDLTEHSTALACLPIVGANDRRGGVGLVEVGQEIDRVVDPRSEEHTSELQSLMRISYAVFFFKKK